jgi:O-succinylbenzoate synthase
MRIERIELRRIRLPYLAPFETSGWREENNHSVIVRVEAQGAEGWGEAPVGDGPWYNEETQATAWAIMQNHLVPMLLDADISSPEEVRQVFSRVRANRIAQSGIEFAVWDLFGRMNGVSMSSMLGGTRSKVDVGVSVGVQASIADLLKVVGGYIDAGYSRIKLKIKPGWDLEPTRAVRERWPDIKLQVDANSIYTVDQIDLLKPLDEFNLLLIEQPLAHDDIFDHAKLQHQLKTPICLDESIVSPDHARWAIEMGACGVINIKPSRVGGLAASKEIHDMAAKAGMPVWHGGMLETGIGRATSVALASLPNFTLPGDISANNRYYAEDVVFNPFSLNADSTLSVSDAPGNGAIVNPARLDAVTLETVSVSR